MATRRLKERNFLVVVNSFEEKIQSDLDNALANGQWDDLINKHGRKNLEEVFLKIVRE